MIKSAGDRKVPKKKISEEEKEERRIEKQNKSLRDQFKREQSFTELSKIRGGDSLQLLCKSFTLESLSKELNATISTLNRLLEKNNHDVGVIKNYQKHSTEQHQRLFESHSKIIDCIFSELFQFLI